MNDDLERLLRSAAQAERPEPGVPYGLETRVLAGWRAGLANPAASLWNSVYRPALFAAGALMLASVVFNLNTLTQYREQLAHGESELTVAGSALHLALTP